MIRTAHVLFATILVAICGLALLGNLLSGIGPLEAKTDPPSNLRVQPGNGHRFQVDGTPGVFQPGERDPFGTVMFSETLEDVSDNGKTASMPFAADMDVGFASPERVPNSGTRRRI